MLLIFALSRLAIAGPPGGGNGVASAKRADVPAEQPKKKAVDAGTKARCNKASARPEFRTGEKAIEAALAEPTQLEFVDTPLSDVIEYLKDIYHIEIQIDKKALEDVGIAADSPITKNLNGISLRSALRLLLRDLDLTYMIDNEVLLITTQCVADARLVTTVYDVADLVAFHDKDGDWDDYDSLIELVKTAIRPTTWDTTGGPGSISGCPTGQARLLVISTTYEIQRDVKTLLENIRTVAKESGKVIRSERVRPKELPGIQCADGSGRVDGKPAIRGPSR
jgi:hypothetical protein